MKKYFLLLPAIYLCQLNFAQTVSIAAERMNVLYAGLNNPITIAVENNSNKSLLVKATNGKVTVDDGQYSFRSDSIGVTEIIVYKRSKAKLIRLGSAFFRVKGLPLPTFKIGSGRPVVTKMELANQEYVRSELDNFDIDARFAIDSFTVCIVPNDSCRYASVKNIGGKINDEIRNGFNQLKENDVVIFKKIFAKGPDNISIELLPVMITIAK